MVRNLFTESLNCNSRLLLNVVADVGANALSGRVLLAATANAGRNTWDMQNGAEWSESVINRKLLSEKIHAMSEKMHNLPRRPDHEQEEEK